MSRIKFVLLVVMASLVAAGPASAQEAKKKKGGQKPPATVETVPPATPTPVVTQKGESPFNDLLFMMQQAPRFAEFPKPVFQGTMAVVAFQEKEMLFLDGCQATLSKKNWQISQCRVARASENDFLTRLVRMGASLQVEPKNADKFNDLLEQLRKVKKPEELDGLMMPALQKGKEGFKPTPEMLKDFEVCGKRYPDALKTLPSLVHLGEFVVMLDFSYGLFSSRPVQVHLVAGRTEKGWKLSKLTVSCQP